MHLCIVLNLLHFLPGFGALYALRRVPNFYEIHLLLSQQEKVHFGSWLIKHIQRHVCMSIRKCMYIFCYSNVLANSAMPPL
jgi:hypothetical protein